ncbi:MAG: protein kinase [Caldilineaceae bacterium]|nr:protein kinase [Caldilineaceae bacterium]
MDLTGKQLGPYQIDREIGRGGMSIIYHAIDTRNQQEVALKILLEHLVHDPITLRRFQQEGENARRLIHPNIVRVHEAGSSDGYYYISMEYASRGTVASLLKERTHPMSGQDAVPILRRVAAALDYAHHRGILHRDIKPSNVLIGSGGQILLSDFGVARHMATDQTVVTLAGYSVGTPAYMSPEQARGDYDLDQRSDIYSLGVVAYAMLTHALPFDADSQLVLLRKIIDEAPMPPEQVNAALPPGVIYALQRVLAKSPQQRYATAGDFVDAIERGLTWTPSRQEWTALTKPAPASPLTAGRGTTSATGAFTLSAPPMTQGGTRGRTGFLLLLFGILAVTVAAFLLLRPGGDVTFMRVLNQFFQPETPVAEAIPPTPNETISAAPTLTETATATPTPEASATSVPPTVAPTPMILVSITEPALGVQLNLPEGWVRTERNGILYFEAPDQLAWLFLDRQPRRTTSTTAQAFLVDYLASQDTLFRTTALLREEEHSVGGYTGYRQNYSATLIGGAQAAIRLLGLLTDDQAFVIGLSSEPTQAIAMDQLYESILRSLVILPDPTPTASPSTTPTTAPTATHTPQATATPAATATATLMLIPTATVASVPTATASAAIQAAAPSVTATKPPTSTPRPTLPPTATTNSNATATAQALLVATSVAQTLTALPTATRKPSATATPLPSATATARATDTPTAQPTSTPAPAHSATPTPDLLLTLTAIDRQLTALAPFLAPAEATPTITPLVTLPTATATPVSAPAAPTTSPQPVQAGLITGFEPFGSWQRGDEPYGTLTQSKVEVSEGAFAAAFQYDFPVAAGNRNYVVFQAAPALRIAGNPAALQLNVYGDGRGHYLNLWVADAANHTWQFTFGQIRHSGWATLTAPLALSQPWPVGAISGGETTQLTPPLAIKALVLDGVPDGVASSGVIYLDALRASEEATVTIPQTAVPAAPATVATATGSGTTNEASPPAEAPPSDTESNTAASAPVINTSALAGRIAYSVFNGQSMDVFVYNLANGNRWRLANRRQPDFSRGGTLIVNGDGGDVNDIVRITQNGEEGVTMHPEDSYPQWSKSSQSIVYASTHQGDGKPRIYWQQDASGRFDAPPLVYSGRELFGNYPVYLDNWRIAYQGCNFWAGGSACGIYTTDTNGGQPSRATDQTADIPSDSLVNQILFTANRNGNWDVYVVNGDGSALTQLTNHPGRDGLATASPDFQHIAFVSDREGTWAVYVMNLDGSNQQKLFDLNGSYGSGNYEWYQERLSWGP